jgi:hypothetical protein
MSLSGPDKPNPLLDHPPQPPRQEPDAPVDPVAMENYVQALLGHDGSLPSTKDFKACVPTHKRRDARISWGTMWERTFPKITNVTKTILRTAPHRCTHKHWTAVLGAALYLDNQGKPVTTAAVNHHARELYPEDWRPPRTKASWTNKAALILEEGLWHLGLPPVRVILHQYPAAMIPANEIAKSASKLLDDALRLTKSTGLGIPPEPSEPGDGATSGTQVNHKLTQDTQELTPPEDPAQAIAHQARTMSLLPREHFLKMATGAAADSKARQLAASETTLEIVSKLGDLLTGHLLTIYQKAITEPDYFEVPEKMTTGHMEKLAKTAAALQSATASAVQTSRQIAGEPTKSILHGLIYIASSMTPAEKVYYRETGDLPARLLTGGSPDTHPGAEDFDPGVTQLPSGAPTIVDIPNTPSPEDDPSFTARPTDPDYVTQLAAHALRTPEDQDPVHQAALAASPIVPQTPEEEEILTSPSVLDRFKK